MKAFAEPDGVDDRDPSRNVGEALHAARSRAYARLSRAIEFPVTLICAPAGYGKSTVVRNFLASESRAYRLLRLGRGDSDALGVLRALGECMADLAPALPSTIASVYERVSGAADASDQLATWAARQLMSLNALVVVDEFDAACDERAVALLSSLIDRTRGHVRWIVIAQLNKGFPVARWLAEDRMDFPVDAADLAFTDDDFREALGVLPQSLDRERLVELCTMTRGAPATIALALGSPDSIDTAPHEPAAMYSYFALGALSRFDRRIQQFVVQTCLFGSFDIALLACAGFVEVEDVLHRLCLVPGVLSRDTAGSYEYDRRFRDFIIERLCAREDGTFNLVAARCAAAYEGNGSYAAASALYVTLGDEEAICSLLTSHGYTLIDAGESTAVQRALAAVRHDILLAFPGALAVKASLESLHGKIDVAEAWFRLALERITDENQRIDIVYRFAIDLVRRERPDVIDILQPVAASMDNDAPLAAPLLALLAAAYAQHEQSAQAAATMQRALTLLPRVKPPALQAKILCQAGFVALHLREIAAAKEFAEQAYVQAMDTYGYDVAARALSVLYSIAIDHDDDVAASRSYIDRLVDASVRAGSRQLQLYATLCRYEIEVYAGNISEIESLDEQLASFEVFYSVLTTETLLPSAALRASWSGDFHRAYHVLESSAEHQVTPDRRALRYAEIALYAAAAGLRKEAMSAAQCAATILRETAFVQKTVLTAQAYIALTFVLLGRHGPAGELLRELASQGVEQPRVALLIRLIGALSERWRARTEPIDLSFVLEELEAAELGGIARMIQALPLPLGTRIV